MRRRGSGTPDAGPRTRCGPTVIRSMSVPSHSPPIPPMRDAGRQCGLEPDHAGRGIVVIDRFSAAVCGAWSVATASMTTFAQRLHECDPVAFRAQRRVDLEQRLRIRLLGHRQPHREVMRRHLGADREALMARAPERGDRALGMTGAGDAGVRARVRQRANREIRPRVSRFPTGGSGCASRYPGSRWPARSSPRPRDARARRGTRWPASASAIASRSRRHRVAPVVTDRHRTGLDAACGCRRARRPRVPGERGDLEDRAPADCCAVRRASATRSGVSIGGVVFAIATTCVNPPAAARANRSPASRRRRHRADGDGRADR